eukprot:CAMPEP_0170519754 /NCGR_PEP_ID=MMETSP0209-20121228/5051_1 /TAXON_ID=665100 ORGANISM="Litonotus pictus, Strain P1" /NCGR_SAMPLE_ID=MMETSP0209 /ASSEMBLY_ACC=CAM_ASM_000301 /LENGTH=1124 /DNA_ID=CAMNT_0010805713 /DNA_START=128 /DNA_END=3502 /DNA_ORIENTATION=+
MKNNRNKNRGEAEEERIIEELLPNAEDKDKKKDKEKEKETQLMSVKKTNEKVFEDEDQKDKDAFKKFQDDAEKMSKKFKVKKRCVKAFKNPNMEGKSKVFCGGSTGNIPSEYKSLRKAHDVILYFHDSSDKRSFVVDNNDEIPYFPMVNYPASSKDLRIIKKRQAYLFEANNFNKEVAIVDYLENEHTVQGKKETFTIKSYIVGLNTILSITIEEDGQQKLLNLTDESDNCEIKNVSKANIKTHRVKEEVIPSVDDHCVMIFPCPDFGYGESCSEEDIQQADSITSFDNDLTNSISNFGVSPYIECVRPNEDNSYIEDEANPGNPLYLKDLSSIKDKMGSFVVGSGVTLIAFNETLFKGDVLPVHEVKMDLYNTPFQNNIQSMMLLKTGCIYLFNEKNYKGKRYKLCHSVNNLFNAWGFNKVRSAIFGPNTKATFYEEESYEGEATVLTGSFRAFKMFIGTKGKGDNVLTKSILIDNAPELDLLFEEKDSSEIEPISNCAVTFTQADYKGESKLLCDSSYLIFKEKDNGIKTKSLLIEEGVTVWMVYEDVGTFSNSSEKLEKVTGPQVFDKQRRIKSFSLLKGGCALFFNEPDQQGYFLKICKDSRNVQGLPGYYPFKVQSYLIAEGTEVFVYSTINFESPLNYNFNGNKEDEQIGNVEEQNGVIDIPFKSIAFSEIKKEFLFNNGPLGNFIFGLFYGFMGTENENLEKKVTSGEKIKSNIGDCLKKKNNIFFGDGSEASEDDKNGFCYDLFQDSKKKKRKEKKQGKEKAREGEEEGNQEDHFIQELQKEAKNKVSFHKKIFEKKQSSKTSGKIKKIWKKAKSYTTFAMKWFKYYYCNFKDKILYYLKMYLKPNLYHSNVMGDLKFGIPYLRTKLEKTGLFTAPGQRRLYRSAEEKFNRKSSSFIREVNSGSKPKKRRFTRKDVVGTPARRKYRLMSLGFKKSFSKLMKGLKVIAKKFWKGVKKFIVNYIVPVITKIKDWLMKQSIPSFIMKLGCYIKKTYECFDGLLTGLFYKLKSLMNFEKALALALVNLTNPLGYLIVIDMVLSQICQFDIYELGLTHLINGLKTLKSDVPRGLGYIGLGFGTFINSFLGAKPFIYALMGMNSFHKKIDLPTSSLLDPPKS